MLEVIEVGGDGDSVGNMVLLGNGDTVRNVGFVVENPGLKIRCGAC